MVDSLAQEKEVELGIAGMCVFSFPIFHVLLLLSINLQP